MVEQLEVCGKVEVCERGGGVWEGWRCVGELVEVCERGREVRW